MEMVHLSSQINTMSLDQDRVRLCGLTQIGASCTLHNSKLGTRRRNTNLKENDKTTYPLLNLHNNGKSPFSQVTQRFLWAIFRSFVLPEGNHDVG